MQVYVGYLFECALMFLFCLIIIFSVNVTLLTVTNIYNGQKSGGNLEWSSIKKNDPKTQIINIIIIIIIIILQFAHNNYCIALSYSIIIIIIIIIIEWLLLCRLLVMHTVFFVRNDLSNSLAEDYNTLSRDCKPNHDGASDTISSA